jgi:hypothetical protein
MLRETKQQSVLKMGRDDTFASENSEKYPHGLKDFKRENMIKELPIGKQEIADDPEWRQRYRKATSREKLEIEDRVIIDFLTQSRRRRGFIARKPEIKAAAEPLNRLERLLDKNIESIRGRPKHGRKKVAVLLNPDFVKHLEDYAQKRGYENVQAAIKWILRDFLRSNGYPVT